MKYKKLLSSLLILGISLGFAGNVFATDYTNSLMIDYFSQNPFLAADTQFIVYCPGQGNILTTNAGVPIPALKFLPTSTYAGKTCQLRLRGTNKWNHITTVTLGSFKFYTVTNDGETRLAAENFERTSRGQSGATTGIYVNLLGKSYPIKTDKLVNNSETGAIKFNFYDKQISAS